MANQYQNLLHIAEEEGSLMRHLGVRSVELAHAMISIFQTGSLVISRKSERTKSCFLAKNVPGARLEWAIQMRIVLDHLSNSLKLRSDCIIPLNDMKLRAAIFRVSHSLDILNSIGFTIEIR